MAITGTGGQALVLSGTNLRLVTDWSRDGSTIFYYERFPATESDLGTLAVTADGKVKDGAKPRLYLSTPAQETWARFSPELKPRWAAYQSDESGRTRSTSTLFRNVVHRCASRPVEGPIRSGGKYPVTAASHSTCPETVSYWRLS
jgi:hypothetical protein